jgi:S1-C subfamily serine protease
MKFLRLLFRIGVVFVIGGMGGIVFERSVIPWLATHEPFSRIPRLTIERVTVLQPREEIIIDRAQALERAVAEVRDALVLVERRDRDGNVVATASGVAITSDGIVATAASMVGTRGTFVIRRGNETFEASFLRRDEGGRVAILRSEMKNVTALPFAEEGDVRIGKAIFLLRAIEDPTRGVVPSVETGSIITDVTEKPLKTDLIVERDSLGAPLFTIEGKLIGIIGSDGEVIRVPTFRTILEGE